MAEPLSVVQRAQALAQEGKSREEIEQLLLGEGFSAESSKVAAAGAGATVRPSALAMKGREEKRMDGRVVGCLIALAVPFVLLVLAFIFILGVCSMKR